MRGGRLERVDCIHPVLDEERSSVCMVLLEWPRMPTVMISNDDDDDDSGGGGGGGGGGGDDDDDDDGLPTKA